MKTFFIIIALSLMSCALGIREAAAQWSYLPEGHSEEIIRIQPKPVDDNEPETIDEEVSNGESEEESDTYKAEKDKEKFIAIEAGFYTRVMNFASNAPGTYQIVDFGYTDKFGFKARFDYLNQFDDRDFSTQLGGYYYFTPDIRGGLNIQFAPSAFIMPLHSYNPFFEFGFFGRRVVPRIGYWYKDFKQADTHEGDFGIDLHAARWLIIRPLYRFQYAIRSGGAGSRLNNAFGAIVRAPIMHWFEIQARYIWAQHSFDQGAPNPFIRFNSQDFGGGIKLTAFSHTAFFFDFRYQKRNNGQNLQDYVFGTLVRF